MNCRSQQKIIILAITLLVFSVSALAADISDFPPCHSPACKSIAEKKSWPTTQSKDVQKIEFYGFQLSIPKGSVETRSNARFRQFDFDNKRWISVSVFERSDTDELFKASKYTMVDWADIVYTQTPADKIPETEAEAFAWYSVLMSKVVFVGQNHVVQYKNKPLVVYSINDSLSGNKTLMIVSSKFPRILVKMEVYGFNEAAELKLIAGLSS